MTTLAGTVELIQGMAFQATSGSGHGVTLDATPEIGGADRGAGPMELLLLGLGGCTGMSVLSVLTRLRQDVSGYRIRLHGEQADEHPKVFTRITLDHVFHGRGLDPERVRRALELASTRYCPAMAMLGKVARIEETYRLIDAEAGVDVSGVL
ncbi:MAG TPA: OsmC family protein [Chloroflexota bacterium]|nr:OsmC family protein [Chloroflexota bacterium]